jgi:hypothetical protein
MGLTEVFPLCNEIVTWPPYIGDMKRGIQKYVQGGGLLQFQLAVLSALMLVSWFVVMLTD